MKRFSKVGLALVVLVIVAVAATSIVPFRNLLDGIFGRNTYTATGPVVLKRLRAQDDLVTASGVFDVPVMVCDEFGAKKPKGTSYPDRGRLEDMIDRCNGVGDEKAVVLVTGEVQAVIRMSELDEGDVEIDGGRIRVRLPAPELRDPVVDAETGISVLSVEGSVLPGSLPRNYQGIAARAGKQSVGEVAAESGLPETGRASAIETFERLLEAFGFTDIDVDVATPPRDAG